MPRRATGPDDASEALAELGAARVPACVTALKASTPVRIR
jgi:hypothetical protein